MPVLLYYLSQMRRVFPILLILVFSLGPLLPTLGASEDTRLPACCRRHGAHHCAMPSRVADMMSKAGKPAFTAPASCPAFPRSSDATPPGQQALAAAPPSLPVLLAQMHSPVAARAAARVSQIRTRAGRGPPETLLA